MINGQDVLTTGMSAPEILKDLGTLRRNRVKLEIFQKRRIQNYNATNCYVIWRAWEDSNPRPIA